MDHLTFSQRYGYADLSEAMRLEHIPQKFRQSVYRSIDAAIDKDIDPYFNRNSLYADEFLSDRNIGEIIVAYQYNIIGLYHDQIHCFSPSNSRLFFGSFMKEKNWHEVLDLVQFILRHQYCSRALYKAMVDAFDRTAIAYYVDQTGEEPTIFPRANLASGEATKVAMQALHDNRMVGAETHLTEAAKHINAGQYADAIADSIHAVESVARSIDPRSSMKLGPALTSLEDGGVLNHRALKQAF